MILNQHHTTQAQSSSHQWRSLVTLLLGVLILFSLYEASRYNYLLFHTLVEFFSVGVAFSLFSIAWNSRAFSKNQYVTFLGIAYFFVGLLHLVHTLAYKGMTIFYADNANLATQLWIAARYLESASLLLAPVFLHRSLRTRIVFGMYSFLSIGLLIAIYTEIFPECYIEGKGLTPFKIGSEYLIVILLGISLWLLIQNRVAFATNIFILIGTSIVLSILAELAFTLYAGVYDFPNLIGHYFKLLSFYLIYKAIIEAGLRDPYGLLFRQLKQREQKLQASERMFRDLAANIPGVVFQFYARPDGTTGFHYVSPRARDIFGLSDNPSNTAWLLGERIHSDDKERFTASVAQAINDVRDWCFEGRLNTPKGVQWFQGISKPIKIDNELVFNGVMLDITERKQIEEALRQNETRLRILFESSPNAIVETDLEGKIIACNRRALEIHGCISKDEFIGRNSNEFIIPEEHQQAAQNVRETFERGYVRDVSYTMLKNNGQPFPGELSASIVKDDSGDPVGFIAITRDITERKQAEAQLRTSLQEKEVLLKEIHHRVKNNLQMISSLLYLQLEGIDDPHTIQVLQESINRVKSMALVHQQLYQAENLANIAFDQFIRDFSSHLFHTYKAIAASVSLEINVENASLSVDTAIPCALILNELLSNALKHAFPEGRTGKIQIDLLKEEERIKLIVYDDGIGIPEHLDLNHLDSLGLDLVNDLVTHQLNGIITITRDGGTTFTITFPNPAQAQI